MKSKIMISLASAITAIVFTVSVSAFKTDKVADFDYVMTSGNPTLNSDRINPANYTKQTGTVNCPEGSTAFCKIRATDNGSGKPIITTTLHSALNVSGPLPAATTGLVWLKAN